MTQTNKYGELEDGVCPKCGDPIKPKWVACPGCGVALPSIDAKSADEDCRHCRGSGRCDCLQCKYTFAFETIFKLPNNYADLSGMGQDQVQKARPVQAQHWAASANGKVRCELCDGTGRAKQGR